MHTYRRICYRPPDNTILIRRFFLYQVTLFLGLPIDDMLDSFLKKVDPEIASIFIGGTDSDYLSIAFYEGSRYLGKYAGELTTLDDLELLQGNIHSLLAKLLPDFPASKPSIKLVALSL